MPAMAMWHETDPKECILSALGDLSGFELTKNQVLIGVYERPSKTKSGLHLADITRDEDKFQGKVGMIVKLGPDAFVDDEKWTFSLKLSVGNWVFIRASEGFALTINGKLCRIADDVDVRGRISHPDMVW